MNKIDFNSLKESLKKEGTLKILSTDIDQRYDDSVKILSKEVPNIEYINVNEEFIENFDEKMKEDMFELYKEIRVGKEEIEVLEKNFKNPNFFSNLLVKSGWAHGIVSGATHPTSDILRAAFQVTKPRDTKQVISSFVWLSKDNHSDMFFSDISVMPNPNAEQLAQIAMQTADSVKDVFDTEPVIAMLSFSTNGSGGKQESVLKVQEATKIVKEANYNVYGDIQWDAAVKENVFAQKMKASPDKMPNVFIFPDLNAGNIGYKIAATLGGFNAVGPILQNISKPVNDLSRGCNAQEIADLVIITAMQAVSAMKKENK